VFEWKGCDCGAHSARHWLIGRAIDRLAIEDAAFEQNDRLQDAAAACFDRGLEAFPFVIVHHAINFSEWVSSEGRDNSEAIIGHKMIHSLADDERVFVTYELAWTTGRASRNTEIFTLRNGKIVDVEVYFGWSIPHEAPEDGFVKSARP
jgi:hypothetical protein